MPRLQFKKFKSDAELKGVYPCGKTTYGSGSAPHAGPTAPALRLHRNVERGDRPVGDDHGRIEGERPGRPRPTLAKSRATRTFLSAVTISSKLSAAIGPSFRLARRSLCIDDGLETQSSPPTDTPGSWPPSPAGVDQRLCVSHAAGVDMDHAYLSRPDLLEGPRRRGFASRGSGPY
jgi:hypothetical protein